MQNKTFIYLNNVRLVFLQEIYKNAHSSFYCGLKIDKSFVYFCLNYDWLRVNLKVERSIGNLKDYNYYSDRNYQNY